MGLIKKLDPIIANKIAAGEVIEKLANVIKELVENAIDAQAKKIDIELQDSGLKMMRVIDDGLGMDEDDLLAAFERHATSKISSVNDLFRIKSLGFRGEAIPSIASISKMTITSNLKDSAKAVVFDNGQFIEIKDASLNQGTMVEVEKIFYYTPARFKYLKSEQYELALIQALIYQFALSYPNISFRLSNNQKLLFSSNGQGSIKNLMAQIYGINVGSALLDFQGQTRDFKIYGKTTKPVINRSNRQYIHIIVNHRVIQDTEIVQAILESYDQLIPKQRYPITVLYIDVDPLLIDVNVHPRKQEVKFSEKQALIDLIRSSISEVVKDKPIFQEVKNEDIQTTIDFTQGLEIKEENQTFYENDTINIQEEKRKIIPDLSYIGQYSGTYLLFQNDQGLYMVDQHAAAERIRYERYAKEMQINNQMIQTTIFPIRMDFPADVLTKLKNHKDDIENIGIKFDINDDHLLVKEIPLWFPKNYEDIYMETIIDQFSEDKRTSKKELIDDLAILLACKHSLKANHYITKAEADHLIKDLRQCQKPYTCPHGRPIIVEIKHSQVEHWFNRVI
ncbi:DNA mismatch repair endonuclease MutL [Hujiaoplasma nucleasis]|uniref:DNA mismatch repair protein MutL n=1 Tax=Hujiaoplasma nucleasis TaxID=2725268 RepID=A0A7L6N5A6_9MOLU|nr:DNA mismatch repair endonuclease MutL [Hujiaoplasma nucleasis]QLY39759.1 DNA mismatch repair endonuclease MutL [Hujiaoplasma nucleasis]